MNYVRRQRAGSQEFGDKKVHEDQADYDLSLLENETEDT
jgi:hypothetical protein